MASTSRSKEFFIVGIGASAGGLSALEAFFAHLPNTVNATFVVAQHLSPHQRSHMVELLQRHTTIPVRFVEDGMAIAPNGIYVIPPGHILTLTGLQFRLDPLGDSFSYPIDRFFKSLALEWRDRAIAIVLSGTGSDGTRGLEAVSRAGGIALVQSPETAEFSGMPLNAIPAGMVDEILSPQDLAGAVCDLIYFAETQAQEQVDESQLISPERLTYILEILKDAENIDFSNYKVSTISRRIAHRRVLTRSSDLDQYIHLLVRSDEEKQRLRQDLLISVTQFFRDPPAWQFLRTEVLPPLIARMESGEQLRIWVAACATGEEAYSIAMLVDEAIAHAGKFIQVKIFATDVDTSALEVASRGIYDASNLVGLVPSNRLERYFIPHGNQFQVKKSLREMLIFAPHDLTRNAGFSRMHLVCCRNVLIYMQPQLQQQVIRRLHFSLTSQGILFLGNSEILGDLVEEFITLNSKWKIFQKRRNVQIPPNRLEAQPSLAPLPTLPVRPVQRSVVDRMIGDVFAFCFGDRNLTCLLINQDNHLVQVFYNRAQVLDFPVGQAQMDVTELVLPELKLPLSIAIHRARRDQQAVMYPAIRILRSEREEDITLHVGGSLQNPAFEDYLVVMFEVNSPATAPEVLPTSSTRTVDGDITDAVTQHVAELEYELQHTRENLQATIEELETSNEEQQATNEELLAAIEELQSTNEELQSVNEELYTINAEYEAKIQELTQLTNDIENLLRSTNIGVIFLDSQLHVRKFTPAATQYINLQAADIFRPIAHFTHTLDIDNLLDLLQQVVDSEQAIEREVRDCVTGDYLLMRLHPYRQDKQMFDGVVLTFVKINDLKQAQFELQYRTDELEHLYSTVPIGLGVFNENLRCLRANRVLARIDGYDSEVDHAGKTVEELVPHLAEKVIPNYRHVLETGEPILNMEVQQENPENPHAPFTWLASYHPLELLNGERAVGVTVVDITDLQRTQATLQVRENFIQRLAESIPGLIFTYDLQAQQVNYLNQSIYEYFGYTPDEIQGMGSAVVPRMVHPEDVSRVEAYFQSFHMAGDRQTADCEYRVRQRDGHWRWLSVRGTIFQRSPAGAPQEVLAIALDISDRKQVEAELSQSHALRDAIFNEATDAIFLVDPETRMSFDCNQRALELFEAETKDELLSIEGNLLQQRPFTAEELSDIRATVRRQGFWRSEVEYVTRHGNSFWGDLSVKQIQVGGRLIYLVRVVDISDRKQVELGLARNMEELQRLNLIKDDFLSTVSHELRTPLTNMDMASRMLRLRLEEQGLLANHDADVNHLIRYMDILEEQCHQERELIEDLLDLQRLNADAYELDLKAITLDDWLMEIAASFQDRAWENQRQFEVLIPADLPEVQSDPGVLKRIIMELLNNACKYTPPGERICLDAQTIDPEDASTSWLQIRICNSGIEITPEDQEHIFEPFYRVVQGDRWSKRGTGLGLPLAKKFTHRLGGSIHVESSSGQTRFVLQLPL
jgi:two-component system CheB/CheR fusion protein